MSTVGQQLREAREAQGWDLAHVAEVTKIMTKNLGDLESGDYNSFAAPVYIRGFVRTYASLLKLDVIKVMADLDHELGQTERFSEPPSLSGHGRGPIDFIMLQFSRLNWRLLLPLVGLVAVLVLARWGYHFWQAHRTHDPLAGISAGMYTPATPGGETLPLTPPRR
jgi:cytoskeletal protein RodZ